MYITFFGIGYIPIASGIFDLGIILGYNLSHRIQLILHSYSYTIYFGNYKFKYI